MTGQIGDLSTQVFRIIAEVIKRRERKIVADITRFCRERLTIGDDEEDLSQHRGDGSRADRGGVFAVTVVRHALHLAYLVIGKGAAGRVRRD